MNKDSEMDFLKIETVEQHYSLKETIQNYYRLTKPGIIYGNAIAAIAGFLLASRGHFNPVLFLAALVGLSLVIGSGCVVNNYIDRTIDEKMARTKKRALVTKIIPPRNALIFATILGLLGFFVLFQFTNLLTTFIAFVGYFFYVVLYSIWKRKSIHGTVVGSVSGAVPPVVGYCAVTNHFDAAALLLFLILVFWQMPHFYAIAIFRMKDYAAARIPVLPVKKGIAQTKLQIILYIVAFIIATALLTVYHYTGYSYLVVVLIVGFIWLWMGFKGYNTGDAVKWSRKMFFFSLVILLVWSGIVSLSPLLP
jgi:protoheme IX farnesyltransferase